MDTWIICASSGAHRVTAETAGHAFQTFTETHPDDYVGAIVSEDMMPELIKAKP